MKNKLVLPVGVLTQHLVCLACASIVGLLFWGSPSAIFRRVVSAVVAPVKRMVRAWSRSHISEEIRKAFAPTMANTYSAFAVIFEVGRTAIVTTVLHALPCMVFDRTAQTVCRIGLLHALKVEATAGKDFLSKLILFDLFFVPAFAPANPIASNTVAPRNCHNAQRGQTSKNFSCQILRFHCRTV